MLLEGGRRWRSGNTRNEPRRRRSAGMHFIGAFVAQTAYSRGLTSSTVGPFFWPFGLFSRLHSVAFNDNTPPCAFLRCRRFAGALRPLPVDTHTPTTWSCHHPPLRTVATAPVRRLSATSSRSPSRLATLNILTSTATQGLKIPGGVDVLNASYELCGKPFSLALRRAVSRERQVAAAGEARARDGARSVYGGSDQGKHLQFNLSPCPLRHSLAIDVLEPMSPNFRRHSRRLTDLVSIFDVQRHTGGRRRAPPQQLERSAQHSRGSEVSADLDNRGCDLQWVSSWS